MKTNMNTKDSCEPLLRDYADAATKHGRATNKGDYQTANQQYEIMANVCRELRVRGREFQLRLLGLLEDPDPYVRLWASSHSLEFAPEVAVPILEELSRSGGLVAFDAEMTLGEWQRGALRFP